jgi:hypothetical protein
LTICKTATTLRYQIYTSITEIADAWDTFIEDDSWLMSQGLLVLEKATDICPIYIKVIGHSGEIQAFIYLQKNYIQLRDLGLGFFEFLRICPAEKEGFGLLICGNTFSPCTDGILTKNNLILKNTIIEELPEILRNNKIAFEGIIIKDTDFKHSVGNFKYFGGDFGMEMSIYPAWNSIEDYAACLDKKYSKRLQKIKLQGVDLKFVEIEKLDSGTEEKVFALFENVSKKSPVKIGNLKSHFFRDILIDPSYKLYIINKEDKSLGFSLLKIEKECLEIQFVGLDYEQNENHAVYLNILYHGLEMAIKLQKSKLKLGRTALVAKASLGAEPSSQHQLYYFQRTWLQKSFSWVLKQLYSRFPYEKRRPFKNKYYQDLEIRTH